MITTGRDCGSADWINKTGVINDPFGQTLFSLEICFVLLNFEKWGQMDEKCMKAIITLKVGRPSGSKRNVLSYLRSSRGLWILEKVPQIFSCPPK